MALTKANYGEITMTVKELINFLSKQDPDAKVTLTKTEYHEGGLFGDDEYLESENKHDG